MYIDIADCEESGIFGQVKRSRLGETERDITGGCQREHERLPGLEENYCQLNGYFISGSTLRPEELLLYALMSISFKCSFKFIHIYGQLNTALKVNKQLHKNSQILQFVILPPNSFLIPLELLNILTARKI